MKPTARDWLRQKRQMGLQLSPSDEAQVARLQRLRCPARATQTYPAPAAAVEAAQPRYGMALEAYATELERKLTAVAAENERLREALDDAVVVLREELLLERATHLVSAERGARQSIALGEVEARLEALRLLHAQRAEVTCDRVRGNVPRRRRSTPFYA